LFGQDFWVAECCSVLRCFFFAEHMKNEKHSGILESCLDKVSGFQNVLVCCIASSLKTVWKMQNIKGFEKVVSDRISGLQNVVACCVASSLKILWKMQKISDF